MNLTVRVILPASNLKWHVLGPLGPDGRDEHCVPISALTRNESNAVPRAW